MGCLVLAVLCGIFSQCLCSPLDCQRIDAAVTWGSNNKTYFFSGNEYIVYNDDLNAEEDVHDVSNLTADFPTNIDAAVNWFGRNQSVYFKGCNFYQLDELRGRLGPRNPLSELGLPCDVNAALNTDARRILVFKGCQYWSVEQAPIRAVLGGTTADLGLPCDLDAAVTRVNGTSYVIKANVMWLLTSHNRAGAPQSVDDLNLCSWRLCENDDTDNSDEELSGEFPCNGDRRFCRLRFDQTTLAGSHNAGSGFDGDVPFSCVAQNQAMSVLDQMRLGIRYLDVDSSWQQCGLLGSNHGMDCGGPICKMIKQIKRFLRENRHEVLAINFNHDMRDHERVIPALVRQLTSQLGPYLNSYYRDFGEWPSLGHAVKSNKRLIVIMDKRVTSLEAGNYSRHLWVHSESLLQSTWRRGIFGLFSRPSDCNPVVKSSRVGCQTQQHAPLLEISVFSFSLLSCVTTIADLCLPLVHVVARQCQAPRHSQGKAPNILLVDYPERAPRPELSVVHAAFLQNVRNVARLSRESCELHVQAAVLLPEMVNGEHLVWMSTGSRDLLYNWNISMQQPHNHSRPPRADRIPSTVDAAYISPEDPRDICYIADCSVSCMPAMTSETFNVQRSAVSLTSLGLPCDVQAAFTKQGVTYFLKGCQFWQRELSGHVTGPSPINNFGLPCDVTAALESPDGSTYFFKEEVYWKLTNNQLSAPKSILDWPADLLRNC